MKRTMEEEEADWSELPMDLLELIVRRFDRFPDNHVRFGAVCESWRSVAMENRRHIPLSQFPGLMVPGTYQDSPTRCFRRLNHETGYFEEEEDYATKQLEVPHGHACCGSAYGWLFLTDDELNTELLNPFSGAKIQLPSAATLPPAFEAFHPRIKGYVFKAVFSSNPSFFQQQPRAPVILIIYGGSMPRLAYCKPGDEAWTALDQCLSNPNHYFMDAIYYKDRFLALDVDGEILALDIDVGGSCSSETTTSTGPCEVKVTRYAFIPGIKYVEDMFLVELEGVLVVLTRKVRYPSGDQEISNSDDDDNDQDDEDEDDNNESDDHEDDEDENDDDNYEGTDYRNAYTYGYIRTAGFTMLRLETSEQKWVKVKSLGDNALFLGYNTSFSLRASEYPGCIPNSVYFTGCVSEDDGYDMGIYNFTDKSIKPLYSIGSRLTKPVPIWITRLPC